MSDEESFVILGTSPMSSLTSVQQEAETPKSNFSSFRSLQESAVMVDTEKNSLGSAEKTLDNSTYTQVEKTPDVSSNSLTNGHITINSNDKNSIRSGASLNNSAPTSLGSTVAAAATAAPDSLAASFILGEVNADVLKTSVYSQFPSLCSMEACAEDVVKLQNLMREYVELKKSLEKMNHTMKLVYSKTQQWMDEKYHSDQQLQECKEQIAALRKQNIELTEQCMDEKRRTCQQLQEFQEQMATLRNENMELKRDINTKIEQIQITDEMRQKEHDELVQATSEKSSIIENMRMQIIHLEQEQLASYEYIPKNKRDTKENPDYVDRMEHQRVVKEFERQLSELVAKNLDLTDVQKQYLDEITCLKVNYVSAEELIKKLQSEINLLKADNMEKSATFIDFQTERDEIKVELAVLRQQVDVYSRDFEMERNARQNLAGEKDQLLNDLRALQRKNQELIEDAQKKYAEATEVQRRSSNASSVGSIKASSPSAGKFESNINQRPIRPLPEPSSSSAQQHRCPICSKQFRNLTHLTNHVNDCLDKN